MLCGIKYLFWDIDGTLLDFRRSERVAIRECFRKFGLGECSDDMLREYSAINTKYWTELEKGSIGKEEVLRGRFNEFFGNHGIDISIIDDFNYAYQGFLGENPFFFEGALETVLTLKEHYLQYIVTNGTLRTQEKKIRKTGFDKIFDGIYISDVIGAEKPTREFFEFAEKDAGVTDPSSVMIIGDSLYSDIKGGIDSGYRCCWFNPSGKDADNKTGIDFEIRSIPEVLDILL